jgi:hypothetical protein
MLYDGSIMSLNIILRNWEIIVLNNISKTKIIK